MTRDVHQDQPDRRRKNPSRGSNAGFWVFGIFSLALATIDGADEELSSETHPRLRRVLRDQPEADANADGTLTYAEFRDFSGPIPGAAERRRLRHGLGGKLEPEMTRRGDLIVIEFETADVGQLRRIGWKVQGAAFGGGLDPATELMRSRVGRYSGRRFLSSFAKSDDAVGEMLSPRFEIELPYVELHVSGGSFQGAVCVNLIVDDKVVRSATGRNDDLFEKIAWDVKEFEGREARLEILDRRTGLWGHINVDRVVQVQRTDAPRISDRLPDGYGGTAALVETHSERYLGGVSLRGGALEVGGVTVAAPDVLSVISDRTVDPPRGSCAIRRVGGETWFGQIASLADGKLRLRGKLFGERDVSVSELVEIDFLPGEAASVERQPGTLYRTNGPPIPGELVWIRQKDIAIDCALGILPIPRSLVSRYVFREVDAKQADARDPDARRSVDPDEVELTDGSLLRGRLAIVDAGLRLEHGKLGQVSVDWGAVRRLRRSPASVAWLDALAFDVVDRGGPFAAPPLPRFESAGSRASRVFRMLPHTVARFDLPEGGQRRLRARLASVSSSEAAVRVRIRSGETVVWERVVKSREPEISVDARWLSTGVGSFVIEVNFEGRIAFPCGVEWRDGFVVTDPS